MRRQRERGAATVLVVTMLGLLLWVGSALGVVAAMVVDHRRAQSAADLAALAGAVAQQRGADPCAAAATTAGRHGAALTGCTADGTEVRLQVRVPGPRWLGARGDLEAEARAGPAVPTGPS